MAATLAAAVTLALFEPTARTIPRLGSATAAGAIVAVAFPIIGIAQRPAAADDPGQGPAVPYITLTAAITDTHVELTARRRCRHRA